VTLDVQPQTDSFSDSEWGTPRTPSLDSVWPESNTTWDTFNPRDGTDWSPPNPKFADYNPITANETYGGRVSNYGVEIGMPRRAETGAEGNLLLPFGEGPLNPRTDFNFWNPAQAFETLINTTKRFIPGMEGAGDILGAIGQNIADSDYGKLISNSPMAAAGDLVKEGLLGTLKGVGQIFGDWISPWEDLSQAYQNRDWAGTALQALRLVSGEGITENTSKRIQGALHGDADLRNQLFDEFSAIVTIATLGVGMGTGVLARGGVVAGENLAKVGVMQAAKTVAEEGATKYTLTPLLQNLVNATKFGIAGGYGIETGSEVAAHIFPDWENTNKMLANERVISDDSPFRGVFDLALGAMVNPIPNIGKLTESKAARELMNSGLLGGPSEVERAFQFRGGLVGVDKPQEFARELAAQALQNVALKMAEENPLTHVVSDTSFLRRKIDELIPVLTGRGERKAIGLNSDYTTLKSNMTKEIMTMVDRAQKEFGEETMTAADFQKRWIETKENWKALDAVTSRVSGSTQPLMVYASTVTDRDLQLLRDAITAEPSMSGLTKAGYRKLPDPVVQLLKNDPEYSKTVQYMANGRDVYGMKPRDFLKMIDDHIENVPKEITKGQLGEVATGIRDKGMYKVIAQGSNQAIRDSENPVTKLRIDAGDVVLSRAHPAVKEAEKLLGKQFPEYTNVTLNVIKKAYEDAQFHNPAKVLAKWEMDHSAMYSGGPHGAYSVMRPVLKPLAQDIVDQMPTNATRWGNIISNFREMIPNAELSRKSQELFYSTHHEAWGLTRQEANAYADAIRTEAEKNQFSHAGQYAAGSTPASAGKPIQNLALELFPDKRKLILATNAAQLMEKSFASESWGQFIKILIGTTHGEVGLAPSFFQGIRASRDGRWGDWYRWWAQVGHPTLRYDVSPLMLAQNGLESPIYNWLRGVKNAATDGLLAPALNKAMDKQLASRGLASREASTMGAFPGDAAGGDRISGVKTGNLARQISQEKYMFAQTIKETKQYFGERLQIVDPGGYKMLHKQFGSNEGIVDAILHDSPLKEAYLKGKMTADEVYAQAKIVKGSADAQTFNVLSDHLQNSMRDAIRQAQTTHLANPQRRYWEKSFGHPVLIYPLSWTLKATGEWAKFVTSSMFGYKTGLGGFATWQHLQDATMKALIADPDSLNFIEMHPETVKVMEYLLPGLPSSPIPGDHAGLGFGLMSVPLRDGIQAGMNLVNGRPYDENMSDMSKIGLLRDIKVFPKLWSEWIKGKPETSINTPGMTSGKSRSPQIFDQYVQDQYGLDRK